jgi:hypothetical protein
LSKKWIFVALSGLLVIPLFVGCDAVAPEVKTLQTQMAAIIEWKAQAQADINTAKSTAGGLSGQVNNAVNDVNSLRSQINNLPANNSYTKAEIDAKDVAITAQIATAIAAHLAANHSGSGSGTGTGSGSGGTISDKAKLLATDGELELWLEYVYPDSDLSTYDTRFKNDDVEFGLAVKNIGTYRHEYSLSVKLTPEDDVVVTGILPDNSGTDIEWDGERHTDLWIFSRAVTTLSTSPVYLTTDPDNNGRISAGTIDKFVFIISLAETSSGSSDWKVKFDITEED